MSPYEWMAGLGGIGCLIAGIAAWWAILSPQARIRRQRRRALEMRAEMSYNSGKTLKDLAHHTSVELTSLNSRFLELRGQVEDLARVVDVRLPKPRRRAEP